MNTQMKMTYAESRVPAWRSMLTAAALAFIGALAGLILLAVDSHANTVTVSWQPVSADPNGNPVTLTQYTVYYANSSLLSATSPSNLPSGVTVTQVVVQPSNTSTQITLGPGTYFFRVTASDSGGESAFDSETVDVSTTIAAPPAGAPMIAYNLDETSGNIANDSSGNGNSGTLNGTEGTNFTHVTGSNGTGGAVSFDGTAGFLYSNASFPMGAGDNFTIALNFKTTSTGVKLIGFGDSQTGASNNYDRQLYVDNNGNIEFGVYNSAVITIASPNKYNDGSWHHAAGTMGADGMHLYMDGSLVASNANNAAQPFTGFWKIGYDNLNSWPNGQGANFSGGNYFMNGSVDNVRVYQSELAASDVAKLAGGTGGGLTVQQGNLNGDNTVDAFDLRIAIQALLNQAPCSSNGTDVMNHTGACDATDVRFIINQILAGI